MDARSVKSDSSSDNADVLFRELTQEEVEAILSPYNCFEDILATEDIKKRDSEVHNVDEFIRGQKKASTVGSTNRDVKNVQRWLKDVKGEERPLELIPAYELNGYLAEMFISIRKTDGGNYEPGSLECIKNSIERYLKEHEYAYSLKDRVFSKAIQSLNAKKVELAKLGLGKTPNKSFNIEPEEQNLMYEVGTFGKKSPRSLITTLFYSFGTQFGLRARDEARQLLFGDISLKSTISGEKFLEFKERSTKTRDGSNLKNQRETTPRIYSAANLPEERDPVKLYELYVRRRPIAMMTPDSPFYLTPIPIARLTPGNKTEAWYYPRPMGQNTLGTLLKEAATTAGVQKRITNHSVRKTTVSTLSRAGVPPQKIMKITGHKNIQSITHYDAELNENEHRNINKILQTSATTMDKAQTVTPNNPFTSYARPLVDSTNISSHTVSSEATPQIPKQLNPFMSGSCFYNCTFNF